MIQLKNILKLFLIFLFGFTASFYFTGNLNIIFTIPFIGFCLFNGLSYFLTSLLGIACGTFFYNQYHQMTETLPYLYLLLALCIFFLLYYIFLLLKCKMLTNYLLSTFFSLLITYSIYIISSQEITALDFLYCIFLSAIICLLFSFLIKDFSFHLLSYHNKNIPLLIGILVVLYLSLLSELHEHIAIEFITLLVILWVVCFLAINHSLKDMLCFLGSIFILTTLFKLSLLNQYVYLLFIIGGCLSFNPSKKRWFRPLLTMCCFIIFYMIESIKTPELYYYVIVGVICSLSMLLLPSFTQDQQKSNDYLRYVENKREIAYQLDNFQNMFWKIAENFKTARESRILYQAKKEVFDILCANCKNLGECQQRGKHLLLNYLKDALNNELSEQKKQEIQNYCIRHESYFLILNQFTCSYLLEQYKNEEQAKLKEIVYENFHGFSQVIAQCKMNLSNDKLLVASSFYQNLKMAINNYRYDILYVNNHSTYDQFLFEIAIQNIKVKELKEVLLPLICDTLQTKMEIISINTTTLTYSYFILTVQEMKNHCISWACKQSKEDYKYNGDSYETLNNQHFFYLAISDGMGNGLMANEESKFTIDILFSILKTKMETKKSIHLTNELIHLKNDLESYTTLDFLQIDKQTLKATFLKFGAFTTYIIRDHHVIDISNYSLPLGIVDEIKYIPTEFNLKEKDIILLCSDGMIDDNNTDIISILENISYDDASVICQTLFSQLLYVRKNNDDATLAIVTIDKKK